MWNSIHLQRKSVSSAILAVYVIGSSASWDTAKWTTTLKQKQIPSIVSCKTEIKHDLSKIISLATLNLPDHTERPARSF